MKPHSSVTDSDYQWLNYSKVGGERYISSHPFPSLPFLNPLPLFLSLSPINLEVGRPPFWWFWASAVISPSGVWGGAPAETVFGAFEP